MALLRLEPAAVFPRAYDLLGAHPLGTADAVHLAVVLTGLEDLAAGPVVFVTRDARQAEAARAEGLVVA